MRNIAFFSAPFILEKLGQKSQILELSYFFILFELNVLPSEGDSNLSSVLKIQAYVESYMEDAS